MPDRGNADSAHGDYGDGSPRVALSRAPADCTNACMDGICDCSGEWRTIAYAAEDVDALITRRDQALAEVERLREQVAELQADNGAMREVMKDEAVRLAIVVNDRATLRAEVERLRAALEEIAPILAQVMQPGWSHTDRELRVYAIARRTLSPNTREEG